MSKDANATVIDAIEDALGEKLRAKALAKRPPDAPALQRVALAVEAHYDHWRIAPKPREQVRPFVPSETGAGERLSLRYARQVGDDGEFRLDPSVPGSLTREVKRYLLYTHGVSFHDPLPYLLDYFRLDPGGSLAGARLPAVRALLVEYAELRELVRSRTIVLFPSRMETFPVRRPTAETREDVRRRLPDMAPTDVDACLDFISRELSRATTFAEHLDLVLTDGESVDVYRELLRAEQTRFSSGEVVEPFAVSLLTSVRTLRPDAVTVADLVRIRRDEEMFARWRSTLSRVLVGLYGREDRYSDLDAEFAARSREEFASLDAELREKERSSGFLAKAWSGIGKILVGAVAGGFVGAQTALPGAALTGAGIGAVGGAAQPILESGIDAVSTLRGRPGRATLRRHFLALGSVAP